MENERYNTLMFDRAAKIAAKLPGAGQVGYLQTGFLSGRFAHLFSAENTYHSRFTVPFDMKAFRRLSKPEDEVKATFQAWCPECGRQLILCMELRAR
jgi:hypothetical protein